MSANPEVLSLEDVNNEFILFSQLLPSFVSKKIQGDDFYIKNIVKADWQDGAGRTWSYPIFQRGVVKGDTFAPFTEIDATGATSTGNRPTQQLSFGSKNGTVTPRQYSQQTDDYCLADLQYDWQIEQQLKNVVTQMAQITRFTWSQEYQNVYISMAGHKVIANSDRTTAYQSLTFPSVTPTAPLTWGILETVYQDLILKFGREGAAGYDPDDRPIFNVVGDTNTFQQLKLQDPNFRDDIRWAYSTHKAEGDPLLSTPGIQARTAYRGWKFNIVDFPARYDFVNGAYVQRFPYITENATTAHAWEISPLFKEAAYTATVVFLDNVMKHLVVKPTNFPDGFKWGAQQNFAGEFLWALDARNKVTNPNADKGWWQANYVWGPQGLRNDDLAYAIMHNRCQPADDIYACTPPAPVTSGSYQFQEGAFLPDLSNFVG